MPGLTGPRPPAVGCANDVTSAEAASAVTLTCPGATAVSTGGSSPLKLATVGSPDTQFSPVTAAGCRRIRCR